MHCLLGCGQVVVVGEFPSFWVLLDRFCSCGALFLYGYWQKSYWLIGGCLVAEIEGRKNTF